MVFKKKILLVFGTRPEALKMYPIYKELNNHRNSFDTKICVTAQHREMLDSVLDRFKIRPDYDLDLMTAGQTLSELTSRILTNFNEVLIKFKPNLVLVHGDTTTTFSVSLSCFYNNVKVAHVEAGLRTNNLKSPWPEEFNRQVTSKVSSYHFAPTETSKTNLLNENITKNVFVTGNSIIDTLFEALSEIKANKKLGKEIINKFNNFNISFDEKIILITGHRRENFGDGFNNICKAILNLANQYPDIQFVYPVHYNPNVKDVVFDLLNDIPNIYLIEPLEYFEFIFILSKSFIILTDSGGVQEEAPSLNIPVLVLRNTTERPEALEYGKVKLVGTDYDLIVNEVTSLISDKKYYNSFTKNKNPYGDGTTSKQIVQYLLNLENGI
jgi:UDP-N-acetylglucosamine 2-epimerase (non-hydrolysing)